MVRPASFGWNAETAASNVFQTQNGKASNALAEFDAAVAELESAGVKLVVVDDTATPVKPDAVFPNNWLTTHEDGTVVVYPMLSQIRRRERREDIIDRLNSSFAVNRVVDLTRHEDEGRALEGTGSLVLDRVNRLAYMCESSRADIGVAREWCRELEYELVPFRANCDGVAVYHTNVCLSVGTDCAVICADWLEPADRERVASQLRQTGHEIVEISDQEARAFCGNVLEVRGSDGPMLVGSWSLPPKADAALRRRLSPFFTRVVGAPLPTIWSQGGGGIRCMVCEIFLEERC
ncbi:MAG: hypothetical protein KF857_09205 [Fimbriimonadaceae bacterium]|nr:hypothetical protein [Fimbriimonadaceae bacterium]